MLKWVGLLILVLSIVFSAVKAINTLTYDDPVKTVDYLSNPSKVIPLDSTIVSSPAVAENFLIVQTENSVYRLSSEGHTEWQTSLPGGYKGIQSPMVKGNDVIVSSFEGQISVLSVLDGKIKWQIMNEDNHQKGNQFMDIDYDNNLLFAAVHNDNLYAYSLTDGRIMWAQKLPYRENVEIAVLGKNLFVGAKSSLIVYDVDTGKVTNVYEQTSTVGDLVLDEGILYYLLLFEKELRLVAFDPEAGQIMWQESLPGVINDGYTRITVYKNSIFLTSDRMISISKMNGKKQWESQVTPRLGRPMIHNDLIFVRGFAESLYVVNETDGKIIGRLPIEKEDQMRRFDLGVVIIEKSLFLPQGDNQIYLYELPNR